MKILSKISYAVYTIVLSMIACCYAPVAENPDLLIPVLVVFFLFMNLAGTMNHGVSRMRFRICSHGAVLLLAFELSIGICLIYHIVLAFLTIPDSYMTLIWSLLVCILVEATVFWNGMICVYLTSVQMGITQRFIGLMCGMIPYVNIVAMNVIIGTVLREVQVEGQKSKVNRARKKQKICKTKYPILMVHGVFFRDAKYFNYWGRIPRELEENGATVYYGDHQSADAIANSARELVQRMKQIAEETGCEKFNIIAHSKGGLDCRYAIAKLNAEQYVASLTTINTPHRGCVFADQLLQKISKSTQRRVAKRYNKTMRALGDPNPDFLAAVNDLTASACEKFNQEITYVPEHIYCQSVGSLMKKAHGGKFPLNLSYRLAKYYDGENDGLVGVNSFSWGEKYTLLRPKRKQGISHSDMTDLTRRNLKDFDVREFYVQLVSDLRERGL